MKDDQVLRPAGREHVPGSAHPLPPRAVAWPQWREDYPVNSPSGHAYVLAALRMTVPSGRSWQQHRLVENDALRTRLAPLFGALPMSHSLLQEPHGASTAGTARAGRGSGTTPTPTAGRTPSTAPSPKRTDRVRDSARSP
ncbi:hypothetical protein ACFQ60_08510 [Streptomyces zhihengii]